MTNPLVQEIAKWMFKAYIGWSICADLIIVGGIVYLIFFWWGRIRIDWRGIEKWRIVRVIPLSVKTINANDNFAYEDYALAA